MTWYLAPSLKDLRAETDRRWPNRERASDGAVGDTSHQARVSDHNPDYDDNGVVRATDTDKDGIDVQEFLDAVIGHPAVQYVIWNHGIWSRSWGWTRRAYLGPNPHTGHIHVSIRHTRDAEIWTGDWFKSEHDEIKVNPEADKKVLAWQRLLKVTPDGYWGDDTDEVSQRLRSAARLAFDEGKGEIGFSVARAQKVLGVKADGDWGPKTQKAALEWVRDAQKILGVKADGWWGEDTDAAYRKFRKDNLIN